MTELWTAALAVTVLLYVVLDGFDLGVGMLLSLLPEERSRSHALATIAPVWDGNETWLILTATILFGIFPLVYATLLSAFYLPLFVMLAALVLRGVSFEFREHGHRSRRFWEGCFIFGSLAASFVQGVTVGALVQGLPIVDGRYTGDAFEWATPFALLCGFGLCLGYALLGAAWIALKAHGEMQDFAFKVMPRLLIGVLAFLAIIFAFSLALDLKVMSRWLDRPLLFVFPAIGALACLALARAIRVKSERQPFLWSVVIFLAAFATLGGSFYPYMVPFSITVHDAAAPLASQKFVFWGAGLVVFPITLAYTIAVYFVFKGKSVREGY